VVPQIYKGVLGSLKDNETCENIYLASLQDSFHKFE